MLGKILGQGAYAVVRIGSHRVTSEKVAVKTYEKYRLTDSAKKRNVKREAQIMQNLSHPHTIKLLDSIENSRQIHLVMEYVGGSSLHSYLKRRTSRRLEEAEARRVFRQIVQALAYCHSSAVTHRDIKLENVMMDEQNNVKLIDFGFSTNMPAGSKSKTFCGTPSYMAPEIVARREYYGPPVDVWAIGVLLYAITAGTFPFKGASDKDLYRKIIKGSFEIPECVPAKVKVLIKRMLQVDPLRRPTCQQLLADAWLSDHKESLTPTEEHSAPLTERYLLEVIARAELRSAGRPGSVISPKYVSRTPSYLGLTQRLEKENAVHRVK
jgi:MAP/microtubule affinity-regulating kinase